MLFLPSDLKVNLSLQKFVLDRKASDFDETFHKEQWLLQNIFSMRPNYKYNKGADSTLKGTI